MADGGVEVAVLGPVAVSGAAAPFHRAAALDLAVYLSLHRRPVRHAEWSVAIWPDRAVAPSTVHATASDCRRALGRGRDGHPHLPPGPALCLRDTVTTDVGRFAAEAGTGDPLRVLRAMRLVRGPLFAGLGRADWAVLDGTESRIESMVVGAALGAAGELVERGRGTDAEWLVRRALRLSPYDERLYRMLLRATEAQGNRVGLRAAMEELRALAGESPRPHRRTGPPGGATDPADCLHPETIALYQRLLHGLPAAGGVVARL